MSFRPCLLIPIFNHGRTIRALVERLARHRLPILIVDDGSDEATRRALDALASACPQVRLFRLPQNGGKGAAVMHGLREAAQSGYTHALQIDADGQHDPDDVPKFLERGRQDPRAVVCGRPRYDDSVPKGRLYGRQLTHFWVCVETLRLSAPDSMCGFRLYPLAATCALIDRVRIPTRMDFDIEILVRLIWDGAPVIDLDTDVVYPPDGVSHFDMLRDNLRISRMHTRLFFGMLRRLPGLLRQRVAGAGGEQRHWSRIAERGSVLGLSIVFACYRFLGRRTARVLLYPVVGYFFLTGRKARNASRTYFEHVNRKRPDVRPGLWRSFRHMLAFAESSLDKLAAWAGDIGGGDVDVPQRELFDQLARTGKGALLIGAHLGNLEMMRALAVNERRLVVNAVVFTEHARRFNDLLRQANVGFGANLIEVSDLGADTAIVLKEKIDRGELVVIVGDRTPHRARSGERSSKVEFLGEPAPFAHGPFVLASVLDCPVFLFFCLRDQGRYRIVLESFAGRVELSRKNRLGDLEHYLRRYAQRLEHHCLAVPEQWFNFYDFWQPVATTGSGRD